MPGELERDRAETVALQALGWLAATEQLDAFAAASGADLGAIRAAAGDPQLAGAVLDFVMADDPRARAFCEDHRLSAEDLLRARAVLPGGDHVHWT